jgi:hypothetical protein
MELTSDQCDPIPYLAGKKQRNTGTDYRNSDLKYSNNWKPIPDEALDASKNFEKTSTSLYQFVTKASAP